MRFFIGLGIMALAWYFIAGVIGRPVEDPNFAEIGIEMIAFAIGPVLITVGVIEEIRGRVRKR